MDVGCTVRAPLSLWDIGEEPSSDAPTGRAMIAIVNKEEKTAVLLWDSTLVVPRSVQAQTAIVNLRGSSQLLKRGFLVSPEVSKKSNACLEEKEAVASLSELSHLLPFEVAVPDERRDENGLMDLSRKYKEEGDTLFRLQDYAAAAERYEAALSLTSVLSIGGTVLIKQKGRPVLAEVDCIEGDDIDVETYEQHEMTISESDILLCTLGPSDSDRLQERILLNLSRCLLRLAELLSETDSEFSQKYSKGAILGTTLALSCSEEELGGVPDKAYYIRARAYLHMGKLKHATADINSLLKSKPGDKSASLLMKEVQQKEKQAKKLNKVLAKEMCQWVKQATDSNTVSSDSSKTIPKTQMEKETAPSPLIPSCVFTFFFFIALVIPIYIIFSILGI